MHSANRARETVDLVRQETPDFIPPDLWHPSNPDLNLVDYKIWVIKVVSARQKSVAWMNGG